MNRRVWLAAAGAALLLSGCAQTGPSSPATPPGDRIEQQADDALVRWNTALAGAKGRPPFVPVEELTKQLGDWEAAMGGDGKLALGTGALKATVALPSAVPPAGVVRWRDGTTAPVPLVPATDALGRVVKEGQGSCGTCTPLEVTGATLSTVDIETSRGTATVPAWIFTLRGTVVRVAHVAVDPGYVVSVTPPPWDATNPPAGTSVDSATVGADGRHVTLHFVGANGPANKICGADYTARAVESDTAIVAIVEEHPNTSAPVMCAAVGYPRTATLDLARPLGDRAVLDIRQGLPVTVTKA